MQRQTATTAKPLSLAERKARLARMVEEGEISAERAALIDFREPSEQARQFAEKLKGRAAEFLAKNRRAAA